MPEYQLVEVPNHEVLGLPSSVIEILSGPFSGAYVTIDELTESEESLSFSYSLYNTEEIPDENRQLLDEEVSDIVSDFMTKMLGGSDGE